jgi:hypothetical protein
LLEVVVQGRELLDASRIYVRRIWNELEDLGDDGPRAHAGDVERERPKQPLARSAPQADRGLTIASPVSGSGFRMRSNLAHLFAGSFIRASTIRH